MSPLPNKPTNSMPGRRPGATSSKKPVGPPDVPACLSIGTDVSAKFKGAFCEAKIHHFEKKLIEIRAQPLKDDTIPADHVYTHEEVQGKLEVGSIVQVSYKKLFVEARITHVKDMSQYKIVFNDGDERIVKRNQMLLKGEKHYDSQSNLDNLPLLNPDAMKSSVVDETVSFMGASRSATRQLKAIMDVEQRRENQSEKISAWSSLSDLSDSNDEESAKVEDDGPSTSKKAKKSDLDQAAAKKRGPKTGRSLSPKKEFNEGTAIIVKIKSPDSNKITTSVGVIVSRNAYSSATNDRNKQIADNEVPVRCLPKGDYRLFKSTQLTVYDENKVALDSLNNRTREACEVIVCYKNKGRLPTGWTDESIYGQQQQLSKKSRRGRPHNPKNSQRREKFYRHLKAYYSKAVIQRCVAPLTNLLQDNPDFKVDLSFPTLNPVAKNGVELDLCRLFFTVRQEGGYRAVSFSDKWTKISQKLKWSSFMSGEELRELYHSRLETFEYFQDRMVEDKSKPVKESSKTPVQRLSHGSTPTPTLVDRNVCTTPKKSQTPVTAERKRKVQSSTVPKKQRRGSASSDSEDRPSVISSRKGSSSSPHPSQKIGVMKSTDLDAMDGYVCADIFSQIVETKIIRAAHRTKFYSARVVDARRPPIEIILRILTKLAPIVGTSNNYKFQNRLHRDALVELGRLTAAFVHYCGWNNRFDEWVTIDRIKVSPETKRLSMLTLIRTYSFPSNLLEAIHSFFKRRRITREKYKARRRAINSDENMDDADDAKTPGGSKKKELNQLDGPPAPITLYPELQTFLYDDENFKIPAALPEKIEKDEYDEISNTELAEANGMLSDVEVNNGDESDDNTANTPTTSKRSLKRKKIKSEKEEEKKKPAKQSPAKEKPIVELKKEVDDQQIAKKKKKLVEEKPTVVAKKPVETPKSVQKPTSTAKEKEVKEVPVKSTPIQQKQQEKEKPTTRSATPVKKQQAKIDCNISRPLDFMSDIPKDEHKSGKSTPSGAQLKSQKSEEVLPPINIPISIAIPPQTSASSKAKAPQTPTIQQSHVESIQQSHVLESPAISSPTSQRQTPSRRSNKNVERQPSVTESPSITSPKLQHQTPIQPIFIEPEPAKEEALPNLDFKPFSPISPSSATNEPIIEPLKIADSAIIPAENQFSPRSRFLQTLAQQPQPAWRLPNAQQSDAELAAQFEVHEDRRPISLETLRHIPPALLASHLNIPFSSAMALNQQQMNPTISSTQNFQTQPLVSQQLLKQNQHLLNAATSMTSTPQQHQQALQQTTNIQQPTTSFNALQQTQLPLNPQLLAILQTLQQQQHQQSFVSQTSLQSQLASNQVGTSTSISHQSIQNLKPTLAPTQVNTMNASKLTPNMELDQTPALRCITEYVLLLQYLAVDPVTQETLEALRRNFSMRRYDALRVIRAQFSSVIDRISQLDTKSNEFMDPTMRPLVEQFVSSKISAIVRKPGSGLAPMLQQFVHPVIYNQMLTLPSPSQVAPLSTAQLQLLINQRNQQQSQQARHLPGLPASNYLNDQLIAQQQAQLTQQNTADQIQARLQALLMSMQSGNPPTTLTERAYISPPNDPRPSISATLGQQIQQPPTNATTSGSGIYNLNTLKQESLPVYVPGIYSTTKSTPSWSVSVNQCEREVGMKTETVQILANKESANATLNLTIAKQDQQAECNKIWPSSQTTKIVASLGLSPCEDCGANPSVVEMNVLNQLPFHVRNEILDTYAKSNKVSKERRNRPQCKVKNLSKQAQKQKIERRRNEDMLEELRNGNGKDFMLTDKRFCNSRVPTEPPLMCEVFSSIGFDIFATDRSPESEDAKQKTETAIKEMSKEQVHENVLKLLKEHNVKRDAVDFESLDDLSLYLNQLSDVAEQNQVRLGLANYNVEMTDEITKTVINTQKTIAEEQSRYEISEEAITTNAAAINKNRPKYLMHRGRKGYY